ncbi:MAG: FliH/SctL family protein [Lachnospiraceae bacterium]|nr:FliH/SctL family protein [Lachnospiraceae bacterium]
MKSLSSGNLLKSGNIVKSEETRIIDSNVKVAERLTRLSEILENKPEFEEINFSDDGFSEGLDAMQVEQLFSEPQETVEVQPINEDVINEMMANAQEEADRILSAAREEAESILASANAEALEIKAKAESDGHDEGYKVGYDEGVKLAEEAEQRCMQKEQELEELYEQKIEELEPVFVDKLTDIYEHVFMTDLADKKELVLYLLSDAMRNIEGGKNFLVHVSKDDYEYVLENKDELFKGLPSTSTLEVIEDLTLSVAQCFIEAESGIFDCGLGTELSLLKKELSLLSYRKE